MARLFENDIEFYSFIDKLVQNKKLMDLAQMMEPLDIAAALANDLDLCPNDAAKTTINIYKYICDGMNSGPNIETNKNYPVPAVIRRDNMPKGEEEEPLDKLSQSDEIEEDAGNYINNMGQMSPDMPRHHFPPESRSDEEGWPYGEYTVAIMDPKNKTRGKRGIGAALTCGKEKINKYIFQSKPIFKQDLRTGQGGGAGNGLQQSIMSPDNDQPGQGSSWSRRGKPGWSCAMGEFDLPNEIPEETLENEELPELNIEKSAPVGSSIPMIKFGGRTPGRRVGFQKK